MSFRLVERGWESEFENALCLDSNDLLIVCPFIKRRALARLLDHHPRKMRVITRYNLGDFADRVSDFEVLSTLLERGARVRGIRNLHAKLYVFGRSRAIITSANLTQAALNTNLEFGVVTTDRTAVDECIAYFDSLWRRGETDLDAESVRVWGERLGVHLSSAARPGSTSTLPDYGADGGQVELPGPRPLSLRNEAEQAFVKFLGESDNRAPLSHSTFDELAHSGCHWALCYPTNKRPRIVRDGDLMFIARLTSDPDDIRVFGSAIGLRHKPERDDATDADRELHSWKSAWPHYIRVHHPEFVDGIMENGVSLRKLMRELGADSFASTQHNAARGTGNTLPLRSIRQQPAVRLANEGRAWLSERLQSAFDAHGTIPRSDLERLHWPELPQDY